MRPVCLEGGFMPRGSKITTESSMAKDVVSWQERLKTQPKVKVKLPLSGANPSNQYVQVNGVTYTILEGEAVEVPELVAEILEQSGRI